MSVSKQRVAQSRRRIEQFSLNANRSQRLPLQTGATRYAIGAPQCCDNNYTAEIAFSRTIAQHEVCHRLRASEISSYKRTS